jgi:hypothetical protein
VERVGNGNVQTKNSKVEKNMELIMIFFGRIYMFKEKFIEAVIEMFYVSLLESNFLMKHCLTWWRKQNKYIFCQN